MIYFDENELQIRDLLPTDIPLFVEAERAQGWHGASPEKLESRIRHRDNGKCVVLAALWHNSLAGYVSIYRNPENGAFAGQKIPEIVDFNVLVKFRNRGIGSKLMDVCESIAREQCDRVCLAVGMYSDYGAAQRMYVKRGYIPDGSGLWYQDKILPPYENCRNDDDLVLYMSKDLISEI